MIQNSTRKLTWQGVLKKNRLGQRLLIAFLIVIALASIIHFHEVRVEMLEPNSRAQNYVVARIDFKFPDEEGMNILVQEGIRDIRTIYKIDRQIIDKRYNQFKEMVLYRQEWRKELPSSTFETISKEAEVIKNELIQVRFTDERTLQRLKTLHLSSSSYFALEEVDEQNRPIIPQSFWEAMRRRILTTYNYPNNATVYILNYFRPLTRSLKEDISIQRSLRKRVEENFPKKYTLVEAGTRIIDKGDIVTARQIAMLQAMKKALNDNRMLWRPLTIIGSFAAAIIIVLIGGYYFYSNHRSLVESVKKLGLYATVVILTLIIAKITEYFFMQNMSHALDTIRYPLFIPFASLLLCVLLHAEIAFFTIFFLTIVLGLSLAFDPIRFISINLIAGIVAIFSARSMRKRKESFAVCGKVWLSCIPFFFVYSFMQDAFWDAYTLSDFLSTFFFLAFTSILVAGLLPIFESVFHMMTDITLMEYMDPNNELLRRLSMEAPGTYQHCLVVGSIAEAAAQAIGANGLFCRVSTLYHDIGKLFNPHYFTENQMGGFNIHQLLTPLESTQVIIAHVVEGETLARKNGLPQSFIDIIREHHGTTLVYYFYCKQVEQVGGDISHVDESEFRYPGPKPRSKESAIIMMADTVEAASRSLEDVNEQSLTTLVERLIGEKLSDGQFDECQLTFREFGIIKETIIKMLSVARHLRIKYPEKM